MKEGQTDDLLIEKRLELEREINKLNNKLNIIKDKLFKLVFIKEFILFVKNNDIQQIKTSSKSNVISVKQNLEKKVNMIYNQILSKYNKKKISRSISKDFRKKTNDFNKSFIKRNSKKFHSNINNYNTRNKNLSKMKTESNISFNKPKIIERKSLIIEKKIDINNYEILKEFKDNFNKLEMIILNDLEYLTERNREILNLKKNLDDEILVKFDNNQILSKQKLLYFLKEKNKKLKNQMLLIKNKYSENKSFNKTLYKKLYNTILTINEIIPYGEKSQLKYVFSNLNKDPKDYYKKIYISKTLYIIKTLESIYLLYDEKRKKHLEDKNYKIVLNEYKKEKDEINYLLTRMKIENDKIERDNKIMKKYSKIYITSYNKYDFKSYIKSKKNKKKIQSKDKKENNLEHFPLYF